VTRLTEEELVELEKLEKWIHPAPWVFADKSNFVFDDGTFDEVSYDHHLWSVKTRNAFKALLEEVREYRK